MQKILSVIVISLLSGAVMAEQAALLVYKVWEQGTEPYFSRVLVTENFVRLDEGVEGEGFTLLDREKGIIYNISHEDHSILVMAPESAPVGENEILLLSEKVEEDKQAPMIGGRTPKNVELLANTETCSQLVVVPGLMDVAVDGLRDFKKVLSRVQAATMLAQPSELQTPCDLAANVYAPTRAFDHGLPIQERGEGRSQSLVDFNAAYNVEATLFHLPKGYEQVPMKTLPAL